MLSVITILMLFTGSYCTYTNAISVADRDYTSKIAEVAKFVLFVLLLIVALLLMFVGVDILLALIF